MYISQEMAEHLAQAAVLGRGALRREPKRCQMGGHWSHNWPGAVTGRSDVETNHAIPDTAPGRHRYHLCLKSTDSRNERRQRMSTHWRECRVCGQATIQRLKAADDYNTRYRYWCHVGHWADPDDSASKS